MLKSFLLAGLAASALIPAAAQAQDACQRARANNEAVGTLLGAVGGALLGNAVSSHGGKPGGTIIGGVGGAVVGNRIAASGTKCGENAYGYYDTNGNWVPRTYTAYGYYGPDGRWVAQSPQGYASNDYAAPSTYQEQPYAQGADHHRWTFSQREDRLDNLIRDRMSNNQIDPRDGRRDLRELAEIRQMEADYRHENYDGRLTEDQRSDIDQRLDALRDRLHYQEDADNDAGPRPD